MRRLSKILVAFLLIIFSTSTLFQTVDAQETNNSIWSVNLNFEFQEVSEQTHQSFGCTSENLTLRYFRDSGIDYTDPKNIDEVLATEHSRDTRNFCITQNKNGIYGGQWWSTNGDLTDTIEIDSQGTPTFIPASNIMLLSNAYGSDPYGTKRVSLNYNLPGIGELKIASKGTGSSKRLYKTWKVNTIAPQLTHSDGSPMLVYSWGFSENGNYAALALNSGHIIRIDLRTQTVVPVAKLSATPRVWELAVSNDGNYVYTQSPLRAGPVLHDLTGCESFYQKGTIPSVNNINYSGCASRSLGQYLTPIDSAGADKLLSNAKFSYNNASLSFSLSYRASEGFKRYRLTLSPENYNSQPEGYLAMGDSYSSGEGDTQGGTWYEPGTDEQGSIDTFAGRNLCHLSRRSYPYLIAVELGYLATNTQTPGSDGLFHSVACSGAKIHNIIGSTGEKQDDGGAIDFSFTDNQYRYSDTTLLADWQPGATSQKSFLTESILPNGDPRLSINPQIITLGIGGNDADFGGFIESCSTPGLCEVAYPGSIKSNRQIMLIAQNKKRLASAFKEIKALSPESRIYVHGYPKFVEVPEDYCTSNVTFEHAERLYIDRAVHYMNEVIKSAASEAGVFYVDVENIFAGSMLCSEISSGEQIAVNGVTAGNDIDPKGVCIRNCIGAESFHPTAYGFELYKTKIMQDTMNLSADMPEAVETQIPIPDIFFGEVVVNQINDLNGNKGYPKLIISGDDKFIRDMDLYNSRIHAVKEGRMPNSEAELIIESDPVSLGVFVADAYGVLNIDTQLPVLEPGYHQVHIISTDRFGNKTDSYDTVFVAHSEFDFDGDGINNDVDSCATLANIGVDADNDGIDDICDDAINLNEQEEPEVKHNICSVLTKVFEKLKNRNVASKNQAINKNPLFQTCQSKTSGLAE